MKKKTRCDITDQDEIFLLFLKKNKYCDEIAARIIYQKSEQTFWRRIRKLEKYKYIRKVLMSIDSSGFTGEHKRVFVFGLDTKGCSHCETVKTNIEISSNGIQLRHKLYIKRLAACLENLSIYNGFSYNSEFILNEFKENEGIFISDQNINKYAIRPDIYIQEYKICFEVELSIKHDNQTYGQKLFSMQYLKNINKVIWLVENQKSKDKLLSHILLWDDSSKLFQYDQSLNKKMIFTDTINKNIIHIFDDFISDYQKYFEIILK